ncbi:arginine decarboxylase, partial [Candidatus Hakubella thermalkaliphila]
LLHVNEGKIDIYKLKSYLNILESSSPNSLLLMSLDAGRMQMAPQGYELLSQAIASAEWLRNDINSVPGLKVYTAEITKASPAIADMDPTKLTVEVKGIGLTGYEVDKILSRELKIEPELADHKNVLLFITIGEDVSRLKEVKKAFEILADKYRNTTKPVIYPHPPPLPPQELTPEEALRTSSESVDLLSSLGRVSAQIITPYPPGLPVVSYGEKITPEVIEYIQELLDIGAEVHGLNGDDITPKIRVVS